MSPQLAPEHVTDESRPCWCVPEIVRPCPEGCPPGRDCWRCEGRGVVPCKEPGCRDGALCDANGHITIHRGVYL
jgi:hypothetical protein